MRARECHDPHPIPLIMPDSTLPHAPLSRSDHSRWPHARERVAILAVALASTSVFGNVARAQVAVAAQAAAGVGECAAQGLAQDACGYASDIFVLTAPQMIGALGGGAHLLALPGGKKSRFSLGLRASVVDGLVPNISERSMELGPGSPAPVTTSRQVVGAPVVDVGMSVYTGRQLEVGSLGQGRMGAIHILSSFSYLPDVEMGDFTLSMPDRNWRATWGARVGLLEGVSRLPDISATYLQRGLPTMDMSLMVDEDSISLGQMRGTSTGWRVIASKSVSVLGLAVGMGRDQAAYSARISTALNDPDNAGWIRSSPLEVRRSTSRSSLFGSAVLSLGPIGLTTEVGRVGRIGIATTNPIVGVQPGEAQTYGSAGLRVKF